MRAPALRWAVVIALAISVTGCRPRPTSRIQSPPRPLNRVIITGAVHTTQDTPVAGAHVVAELIHEPTPRTGSCEGILALRGDAETLATGRFTIPIQTPGPQSDVCLVVRVAAPAGSGLRDTTVSGQRFFYGIPPTTAIPTVQVAVVLGPR